MWVSKKLRLPVAAAVAFAVALAAAVQLDRGKALAEGAVDGQYVPPLFTATQLHALVGGFRPGLADVYWIRVIAEDQETLNHDAGQRHVFEMLDRATALDPQYEIPYHFGGILLSVNGGRPELANRLLERAERSFPEDWRFPFYHGFNNLYHARDFDDAGRAMRRAANLPGSPPFLKGLARNLELGGRDPRMLIVLIERMINVIDDEEVRNNMLRRREELIAQLGGRMR